MRVDKRKEAVGKNTAFAVGYSFPFGCQRGTALFLAVKRGNEPVQLAPDIGKRRSGGVQLAAGDDIHAFQIFAPPLRNDIKSSDKIDFGAEKVYTDRIIQLRRENIHDPAAHGELPDTLHYPGTGVSERNQPFAYIADIGFAAAGKREGVAFEHRFRHCILHERIRHGEYYVIISP